MADQKTPQLEISSSLVNYFDISTFYTAFWTVEHLVNVAYESGYGGLEWHPLRPILNLPIPFPLSGLQIKMDWINQYAKDSITSFHQSWRSDKSIRETFSRPNWKLAFFSYLVFPERVESLEYLEKLEQIFKKRLPVVLYPCRRNESSGTERPFAKKMLQPNLEGIREWGVKSCEELIHQMYARGYTGLCLDLYHLRERGEIDLNPWQKTLPKLLPHTQQIHVSAGRIDDKIGTSIDTLGELRDLLKGTFTTDLPVILKAISEFGWRGPVVTEIPAAALCQLHGGSKKLLSPKTLIEDHTKIVGTIKHFLS